jgi:hypothetical protein
MLVLDAGAFVAIERGDREIVALVKSERKAGRAPLTHGGVIGQVWRGGSGRQVLLSRVLPGVDVQPLDDGLGRRAGLLLGRARMTNVIDAAVVLLADDGDTILSSDPDDLATLASHADLHLDIGGV